MYPSRKTTFSSAKFCYIAMLYTMAMKTKTHKGEFAITFFISSDLFNYLWNIYKCYVIIIYYI